jgi:tetratricopeptide (TPR) repeat protein
MGPWFRILALIAVLGSGCSAAREDDFKSLVQRAFELHQKGEWAQALPLLHRAYALEPGDYFVNLLLGIDSLRTGEAKIAVPFLRKASRLRPGEEFPLDYLGEAYARQDLFGEAAEAYLRALRVAPGSAESSIAFVDFSLSRFASLAERMRSSRKGLAAEFRLRALALDEADPSRVALLQRAADLDPSASGIWSDLALATLAQGDLKDAEGCVHKALAADPNDQAAGMADA